MKISASWEETALQAGVWVRDQLVQAWANPTTIVAAGLLATVAVVAIKLMRHRTLVTGVIAGGVGLALLILLFVPDLLVSVTLSGAPVDDIQRVQLVEDARRSIIAGYAVLGAGVSLWYTHRRHQLDLDSNHSDRYSKAVALLGESGKTHAQLAGVYAFTSLIQQSRNERGPSLEVLRAYVTDAFPAMPPVDDLLATPDYGDYGDDHGNESSAPRYRRPPEVEQADTNRYDSEKRKARVKLGVEGEESFPGWRGDLAPPIKEAVRVLSECNSRISIESADLDGRSLELPTSRDSLAYLDADGASLIQARVSGDLFRSSWRRTALHGAKFVNFRSNVADFTGAALVGAQFELCDVNQAVFRGANIEGARFDVFRARGAVFDHARGEATFVGRKADLSGAHFAAADLTGTSFIRVDLRKATFWRTDLTDVEFIDCDMRGAKFGRCVFRRTLVINPIFDGEEEIARLVDKYGAYDHGMTGQQNDGDKLSSLELDGK